MNEIERIEAALAYISPEERDTWLNMGMAIHSELGEAGFDIWDRWSQQSDSYKSRDAKTVWRSFTAGGGITIGTLFHEAKAEGWRDDAPYVPPSPEVIADRQRKAAERAAIEERTNQQKRQATADRAKAIRAAAAPAKADHPYLVRKQVAPTATLQEITASKAAEILGYCPKSGLNPLTGRLLVVPVKQGDAVSTLELIDGDGRKTALAGSGTKTGGYWATQRLPEGDGAGFTLLIGEGVATVLTASKVTGHTAVAALSSGNLQKVAAIMRERYPAAQLVILADLVKATGQADPHAIEAARSVNGQIAIPDFGANRDRDLTDFNDLAVTCGQEAAKRDIEAASDPASVWPEPQPLTASHAVDVNITRGSDIAPAPIEWLWNGWLAAGKMHVFGGAPGTGKTTISMGLAATVTTGGRWPDGTQANAGNVVIWSGEDDPADTLIPRLALSGADLSRVYFIDDIREGNERRSFDPARDMEPLRRKLLEIGGVRLLIVDPIVSAIAGDSHKNAEVRRGLQPLVDLAGAMRCALLGITHFSKGTGGRDPVERLTGSLAFGALARVVLVAAKNQEEGEDGRTVRLFCRAKSNIGPDDGGFEYDLHQGELSAYPGVFASSVVWGEAVEGAARELLATADTASDDGEGGTLSDAKGFLADLLADGPQPTKTIKADADGAGFSWATIRRAQKALKVQAVKTGMKHGWAWRMPEQEATKSPHEHAKMLRNPEDAQQKEVSTFNKIEHLRNASACGNGGNMPPATTGARPLYPEEETTIRAYLASIEETDPAEVEKVLAQCAADPSARDGYLRNAQQIHRQPAKADPAF